MHHIALIYLFILLFTVQIKSCLIILHINADIKTFVLVTLSVAKSAALPWNWGTFTRLPLLSVG